MRRFTALLLALVLLTLSACTPAPAPTPSDMPKPTSMPTPAPVQLPPYHPDVGFDIASTWTAEFGDSGYAILELGIPESGALPYAFYGYQYVTKTTEPESLHIDRFLHPFFNTGIALQSIDGTYYLLDSGIFDTLHISENSAVITYKPTEQAPYGLNPINWTSTLYDLDSDTPSYTYTYDDYYTDGPVSVKTIFYCPNKFIRLPEDQAGLAWYKMPAFTLIETKLPIVPNMNRDEVKTLFGEPFSYTRKDNGDGFYYHIYSGPQTKALVQTSQASGTYQIASFESTNPDLIPNLRGVEIGDSLESVLARFPNELGPVDYMPINQQLHLYFGQLTMSGVIQFRQGKPYSVRYFNDASVEFIFDKNGDVNRILYQDMTMP